MITKYDNCSSCMLLKLTCTLSKVLDEGAHPSTQQFMTSQSTVDVRKQLTSRLGGSTPTLLQFIDITRSNQQLLMTLRNHMSCWYYENNMAVLKAICRWLQRNKMDFMAAYSSWYNTGINVWLIMGFCEKVTILSVTEDDIYFCTHTLAVISYKQAHYSWYRLSK